MHQRPRTGSMIAASMRRAQELEGSDSDGGFDSSGLSDDEGVDDGAARTHRATTNAAQDALAAAMSARLGGNTAPESQKSPAREPRVRPRRSSSVIQPRLEVTCAVAGCPLAPFKHKLCARHYIQKREGNFESTLDDDKKGGKKASSNSNGEDRWWEVQKEETSVWRGCKTNEGLDYYYNSETQATTWEKPGTAECGVCVDVWMWCE
jgi:hypothetical protein